MSDAEAIARLTRGDIGGLEVLVKQYSVQAVRVVYLITRDRASAEDIVQASFLRVYERIHQFDAARPFAPWFLRSVVNDALKSGRNHRRIVPLDAGSQDATQALALTSPERGLDEVLIEAETSEAIWDALGKISAEQRSVIVLRYYLNLSEAEMSHELEVAPGTVKSRLHTARRRLRQQLPAWLDPLAKD